MSSSRYSEINLSPPETVEFRLFKSSLQLSKLIRNAQFSWSLLEIFQEWRSSKTKMTLQHYVDMVADLPREETLELRAWLSSQTDLNVPYDKSEFKRVYKSLGLTSRS